MGVRCGAGRGSRLRQKAGCRGQEEADPGISAAWQLSAVSKHMGSPLARAAAILPAPSAQPVAC